MTELSIDIDTVKGFLDPEEGEALYNYAKKIFNSRGLLGNWKLLR
jgi:hypothetical protein